MRVLLVDDELIIRKGMRTFIPWGNLNCTLVGEASDGVEALRIMAEVRADIVITDIRMPEMDGLKLAENLKELYPDVKIILLTGYDDFEYARRALKFNVVEYLLKPVGEEELTRVLKKTVSEIRKDGRNNRLFKENLNNLQTVHIKELLYSKKDEIAALIPSLEKLDITLGNESEYQIVIVFPISESFNSPIPKSSYSIPYFNHDLEGMMVLVIQPNEIYQQVENGLTRIHQLLMNIEECQLSAAVGIRVKGYTRIPDSRAMAEKAFSSRRYLLKPGIIHSDDLERIKTRFLDTLPKSEHPGKIEEKMLKGFKSLKPHTEGLCAQLLHYCLDERLNLNDYLHHCRFLYHQVQNVIRENGFHIIENQIDPFSLIDTRGSWSESLFQVDNIFRELSRYVSRFMKNGFSALTVQAIDYIKKHFKTDITLKNISDISGLSESHISRVFKKDTGINFIPWVNRYRVEYSKELLEIPDLKLYEIADLSGFSNYKYYSQQFKRYMEIAPQEYRKNHFSS